MSLFDRVPLRYRPLVEAARSMLPKAVAETIAPRFLIGHNPHFVGLHFASMATSFPELARDGFTYENTAHACYTHNVADKRQTVVFPDPSIYHNPVGTLLHEIGHLFDEATGFSLSAPATTPYSRTDRFERVAEAFELILLPPSGEWDAYMRSEAVRPMRTAMGVE